MAERTEPMGGTDRWVCLDVGETLIDETRIWSVWADELGVPRLTFMAALGAVIERGEEHRDVFSDLARLHFIQAIQRVRRKKFKNVVRLSH